MIVIVAGGWKGRNRHSEMRQLNCTFSTSSTAAANEQPVEDRPIGRPSSLMKIGLKALAAAGALGSARREIRSRTMSKKLVTVYSAFTTLPPPESASVHSELQEDLTDRCTLFCATPSRLWRRVLWVCLLLPPPCPTTLIHEGGSGRRGEGTGRK